MRDRSANAQPIDRIRCNHCRGRFDSIEAARDHICIGRGGLPGEPARAEAPNGGGPLRGEHRGRLAQAGPRPSRSSKPRAGKAAEDALAALLARHGYVVQTYGEWLRTSVMTGAWSLDVVREFPWGLTLGPERRFRSDFAHPATRTLIEVDGRVHHVVARQGRGDILRAQLAEAAGYRVVRVLPEQVKDGSALEVIRRAVEGAR